MHCLLSPLELIYSMRGLIAEIFKILFKIEFFKGTYYGFYKRVFKPLDLFHGVEKNIRINGSHFQLHIDDWVQQNVFFLGEYEPAELKAIGPYLKDDARATVWAALYNAAVTNLNKDSAKAVSGGSGMSIKINSY